MAHRTHVCKYCKKRSEEARKFGLSYFCNIDCAAAHAQNKVAKEKKQEAKRKHAKAKQSIKDNDKRLRTREAQKAFNAYIRERDKNDPCISCGQYVTKDMPWGQYDCGHFLTIGGHPELRFEELNAHRQCKKCNGGAGNYSKKNTTVTNEYRINLIKKIGREAYEWLNGPHEPKKYSCEDLKQIELYYKKKKKDLEN